MGARVSGLEEAADLSDHIADPVHYVSHRAGRITHDSANGVDGVVNHVTDRVHGVIDEGPATGAPTGTRASAGTAAPRTRIGGTRLGRFRVG